jgi:chemotaxis signal transduction protein
MSAEFSAHFLVARVGESERLIELSTIREILPAMALAMPEPAGGPYSGVANVRGEVVPVFDLMRRGGHLEPSQLIVLAYRDAEHAVGIVVDDVREIVELALERVVVYPGASGRNVRTAQVDGAALAVLSVREVLDAA